MACSVLAAAGHASEAIVEGKRAPALTPSPPGQYLGNLSYAYRLAGQMDEAATAFEAYHARNPGSARRSRDRAA